VFQKRSFLALAGWFTNGPFLNAYAGAAFNGIGIAQVRASRGISGFGLTVCSKLDARG
jgi:hypothetical protein